MKDELRDFTPDDSSRKTATDWLMKVISGKKPISFHLNGSTRAEDAEAAESTVAVEEMPRMPLGRLVRDREPDEEESLEAEQWTGEFTAEDLCGAPAVPVIKVTPAAKDEITADDVCWVPEERRLKPQPAVTAEYFPTPKLKIVQARSLERPAEEKEPEFRGAGAQGTAALNSEPMGVRGSNEISVEDISREVAPYRVEPIWGGAAESAFVGDADAQERAITAEDICRDWVIQEKQPAAVDTRDGVVLPFSFRVLKSASVVEGTKAADAEAEAAPGVPEIAPVAAEAEVPVTAEVVIPVAEAVATEAAGEGVAVEAAHVQVEPAPQVDEPAFASSEVVPAEVDGEQIADSEATELAAVADAPIVDQNLVEVEAAEASAAEPASDQLAEERAWAEARAAEAEIESALREMEASDGASEKPVAEAPATSVFAREGYWEEAARAEGGTRVEAPDKTPAAQEAKPEMKRQLPLPEDPGEMGQPPEGWMSAWRTLLRLGSVLPWVAKALPMLESASLGEQQAGSGAGISGVIGISGIQEMRHDVSGLRLVQYEIRTTVQDHSMQLKRMEEQLGRVRESLETKQSDSSEVAESVRSMSKLIRIGGIGLGGLLVVLIVLMVMLVHGR